MVNQVKATPDRDFRQAIKDTRKRQRQEKKNERIGNAQVQRPDSKETRDRK